MAFYPSQLFVHGLLGEGLKSVGRLPVGYIAWFRQNICVSINRCLAKRSLFISYHCWCYYSKRTKATCQCESVNLSQSLSDLKDTGTKAYLRERILDWAYFNEGVCDVNHSSLQFSTRILVCTIMRLAVIIQHNKRKMGFNFGSRVFKSVNVSQSPQNTR